MSIMAGVVHAHLPTIRISPTHVLADLRCETDKGSVYLVLHRPSHNAMHDVHAVHHCGHILSRTSWRLAILAPGLVTALSSRAVEWRDIRIAARPEYRAGAMYLDRTVQQLERLNLSTDSPFVVSRPMLSRLEHNRHWRLHDILCPSTPALWTGSLPFGLLLAQRRFGVQDTPSPRWLLLAFGRCAKMNRVIANPSDPRFPPLPPLVDKREEPMYYLVARFYDSAQCPPLTALPHHDCPQDHIDGWRGPSPMFERTFEYYTDSHGNFTLVTAPIRVSFIQNQAQYYGGPQKTMRVHLR